MNRGDIALFRGKSFWSKLISRGTGGVYSHVGMIDKDKHGIVRLIDVVEGEGGRKVIFQEEVAKNPGCWDIFRIEHPDFVSTLSIQYMEGLIGKPYGKRGLLRVAVRYVPIIRWILPVNTNDKDTSSLPPFCSHAVADAVSKCGVDMVRNLPNHLVTPNHISWCPYLTKVQTV